MGLVGGASQITSVKFEAGSGPLQWPIKLSTTFFIAVILPVCYYLAAVVQHPDGGRIMAVQAGWRSIASYLGLCSIVALAVTGLVLQAKSRLVGMFISISMLCYLGPMIAANLIAILLSGSVQQVLITFLLSVWSVLTLLHVNTNVTAAHLQKVANTRLKRVSEDTYVLPSSGSDQGESVLAALSGSVSVWTKIAELGGAVIFILVAPLLLPISIASEAMQGGPLLFVIWFVCVSLFLAVRYQMNTFLVLLRAAMM